MRSINPEINVQLMAAQLGGGGHVLAAGFKLENTTLGQARQQVLKVVNQELNKQLSLEKGSSKSDENSKK